MPHPVTVSIDVHRRRQDVFTFLDRLANHEPFNDHLMRNWQMSGPDRGVGSKALVQTKALGVTDLVEIEVMESDEPVTIVERNVASKVRRVGQGTYFLEDLPDGGTHITFEYRWITAPLIDRLSAPIARAYIRRNNTIALRRLAAILDGGESDDLASAADRARRHVD
jgi:hypothetical protein